MPNEFNPSKDYYAILGLTLPVTSASIAAAYARKATELARGGATPQQRQEVEEARRVLSDLVLRAGYDKAREKWIKSGSPAIGGSAPAAPVAADVPVQKVINPPSVTQYEPASAAGIQDAERRVNDFPDDLDALSWLAFQYYSAGDNPKAIEAYTRYLEGRDEDPEAHYYLARTYERVGQKELAKGQARRVIELEPNGDRAAKCQAMLAK